MSDEKKAWLPKQRYVSMAIQLTSLRILLHDLMREVSEKPEHNPEFLVELRNLHDQTVASIAKLAREGQRHYPDIEYPRTVLYALELQQEGE